MTKKTREPVEDLVYGCLGPILLMGMVMGAAFVGIVWGLVELFQWMF